MVQLSTGGLPTRAVGVGDDGTATSENIVHTNYLARSLSSSDSRLSVATRMHVAFALVLIDFRECIKLLVPGSDG